MGLESTESGYESTVAKIEQAIAEQLPSMTLDVPISTYDVTRVITFADELAVKTNCILTLIEDPENEDPDTRPPGQIYDADEELLFVLATGRPVDVLAFTKAFNAYLMKATRGR
jgi:hypothetical protein